MIITTDQLKQIIAAGGSLVIDGSTMPFTQLRDLATEVSTSKATITIRNVGSLTNDHLKQLAAIAPGQVTYDLT